MTNMLRTSSTTDADRKRHDVHRHWVPLVVFATFCLYAYLFTFAWQDLLDLPLPGEAAQAAGWTPERVFDEDRNVDSKIVIPFTQRFSDNEAERLALYLVVLAAFLSAYYLPLAFKRPALAAWTIIGLSLLYGGPVAAGVCLLHLVVFLLLHPPGSKTVALCYGAAAGALGLFALPGIDSYWMGMATVGSSALGYRFVVQPLLRVRFLAEALRWIAVQSALLFTFGAAITSWWLGWKAWKLPVALLLFFLQWQRLILYHIDYKDGRIPADAGLTGYLTVFFSPAVIPSPEWNSMVGQGYAYVHDLFLRREKNAIVLNGVRLLLVALLYLMLGEWIRHLLIDLFTAHGVDVHRGSIVSMIRAHLDGERIGTTSVLVTTGLDLVRWTIIFASIDHFRVGLWRLFGFDMDPNFNKPWMATNLVAFWRRYTFHYREFLVRAFFYPVFFQSRRLGVIARLVLATMAALFVGNMVWGHMIETFFGKGLKIGVLDYYVLSWPYFLLLGLGVAAAEIRILKKPKGTRARRPWTLDRWLPFDLASMYVTVQFYALIHIFIFPARGATLSDLWELFLIGIGIRF
ncbi:MAG: hypothetical protein HQL63_04450 [Magnetococcales bacterium]|nr:hypothetical protein [Magnetococcales bacterium]